MTCVEECRERGSMLTIRPDPIAGSARRGHGGNGDAVGDRRAVANVARWAAVRCADVVLDRQATGMRRSTVRKLFPTRGAAHLWNRIGCSVPMTHYHGVGMFRVTRARSRARLDRQSSCSSFSGGQPQILVL